MKRKDGQLRPEEYECHFRLTLQKSINQPNLKRRDVWYVDPAGKNLELVVADAKKAIQETGLSWFTRFDDPQEVLRTLLEDSVANDSTHGFGADPSPIRHFMTGFAAHAIGQTSIAKEHLSRALASNCFIEFEPEMHSAMNGIKKRTN